jgi:hypothetical protein
MFFQPKWFGAINRNDLVNAVTEQKSAVQDGNLGFVERQKVAVEIYQPGV